MLYAILEEIEKRHPGATVVINDNFAGPGLYKVKTSLRRIIPLRLLMGDYPRVLLSRLKLPHLMFTKFYPARNVDIILDASGFRIGDQWIKSREYLDNMAFYYKTMKKRGTKIIFLPQAFGPFETENAKKSIQIVLDYADLLAAREHESEKYLLQAGADAGKVVRFPDFTNTISGIFPEKYQSVKGGICIIPNRMMLSQTGIKSRDYHDKMTSVIQHLASNDNTIFFLNHEGNKDLEICRELNRRFDNRFPIINGLGVKEIKGVIGSSYLVVSSRYHGVASSLNQGVPCLATSWSHKYRLLFHDFHIDGHIIEPDEVPETTNEKIDYLLDPDTHARTRNHLAERAGELERVTRHMWDQVWQVAENRDRSPID